VMGASQKVQISSGEQPRYLNFGRPEAIVSTITSAAISLPLYKESPYTSFQAILLGSSTIGATITIQSSLDDNTGRGFVFGGGTATGTMAASTNGSATITASTGGVFTSAMIGAQVYHPGFLLGTTIAGVSSDGRTASASAAATASVVGQLQLYAQNWCATALGTITLSGNGNLGPVTDGFTTVSPWRYIRASAQSFTGTVTSLQVLMGV
jgi:hypothetical protein